MPVSVGRRISSGGRIMDCGCGSRPAGWNSPISDWKINQRDPGEQCGDLLLMDRLGNWTYQFAVTADDLLQGVNLVIRGEDLLPSTGRQILLARMLGRSEPPKFLHHGLIRKPGGEKLSKAQRGYRDS